LFIDRDGVINHEKKEAYILNWKEFNFYAGVLDAMAIFSQLFGRIVMVTNQRGIGKGLMTEIDLAEIHDYMLAKMQQSGGRIDKIYYCTALTNEDVNRKPNPGRRHRPRPIFLKLSCTNR
jgi:D-glycero-D-manno-heptose 1,7-bisphosphate phosphatase